MLQVVAGIIIKDDKILLCQRHRDSRRFPLKWEFPGGKVEVAETPHDAIARELKEELDVEITDFELLYDYQYSYPNEKPIHLFFYNIKDFNKEIKDLQFEKIEWVDKAQVKKYDLLKGDIPFCELYFN